VRYENGQLKPALGYIATLAQYVIEQGHPQTEAQQTLLEHINRAVRANYDNEVPFASWSELDAVAVAYRSQSSDRFETFLHNFKLKQIYTPREKLPLSDKALHLVQELDFIGVKWSNVFGFTVGLIQADGLSLEQIQAVSEQFVAFNNLLYRNPKELQIPNLVWLVAFTLGGVLCFVFEQGSSPEVASFVESQKKGSPAYDQGSLSLGWTVQTRATTFIWTVDLKDRQVYRHFGKQPDKLSYHTRQMTKELAALREVLKDVLEC
jgi:hypothetical protein